MTRRLPLGIAAAVAFTVAGCGPAPAPSASAAPVATVTPTAAPSPTTIPSGSATAVSELVAGAAALAPGTYTNSSFRPRVIFSVEDGWVPGTVTPGFFDVQQDRGTPDVIAVQFATIDEIVGAAGAVSAPATAASAAEAIGQNPGVVVLEESGSKVGGLDGLNVTIENTGSAHAPLLRVSAGMLGIDPGRRLWISLFDTPDGVLAIMVGGSIATWDNALLTAEPVLESVLVEAHGAAASPSA